MLHITALMDNVATEHKTLIAEHGLSLLVHYNGKRILFDCGAGPHPLDNAHSLGLDLKGLDGVVLSHSHYDHAAGYRDLIERGLGSKVLFTGPGFFYKKFARNGIRYTNLSAGFDQAFLEAHGICWQTVQGHRQILPGVHLVGNFPRIHPMETIPQRFVRQVEDQFQPDDFSDEICMALEVEGGLAVLVGCSHPGILNMIAQVKATLNQPIRAVFGGTHLVEADGPRIRQTIDKLTGMGMQVLGLSHCSGQQAESVLEQSSQVLSCHLGSGDCIFMD